MNYPPPAPVSASLTFENLPTSFLLAENINRTRTLETMYIVSGTVTLGGYTRDALDAAALSAAASATASIAGVSATTVTIAVSAVAGRRRMVQADAAVDFAVRVASMSCATRVAANINSTSPSAYVAALRRAGLSSCSAVTVSALSISPPELLLSPETVTAGSGSGAAALIASVNASAAAAIQSGLLVSLATANAASLCSAAGDAQVTLTATQAEYTALFVLDTVNATANSPAAVSVPEDALLAALEVLLLVATSSAATSATSSLAVAKSVTLAMSVVASAALQAGSAVAMQHVQAVLMALMNSTAISLVAQLNALPPGSELPAVNVSSPMVSWVVRVDPPGS